MNTRTVLITGALTGIGRATALAFAREGASNHAVEGLTKSAALEAAPYGVRVNIVAPGPIETEMLRRFAGSEQRMAAMASGVPLNRPGRPEEIAEAILFVASEKASYLSGASIPVNGGKAAL